MAILQKFKCKGSVGVYYGLGKEEIEIDFSGMSGLIALAGENGCAKTTVLEMLSPFDVFKSRQLKNPKKYNLKDQFLSRDSFKEVTYFFNGKEYVFRVEVPAGTTMSPEGYITEDGVPMVKGKISEYRKKVVELFGSEELFYSSIFSCQGGKKITDKTVGEFKDLLIELLGLKKYTKWWGNVGKAKEVAEKKLTETLHSLSFYDGKEEEIDAEKKELDGIEFDVLVDQKKKTDLINEKAKLKLKLKELNNQKSDAEKKEFVLIGKKAREKELLSELSELTESNEKSLKIHNNWIMSKKDELSSHKRIVLLEDQIINAESEIDSIKKEKDTLSDDAENINNQIDKKQKEVDLLSEHISTLSNNILDLRSDDELALLSKVLETSRQEYRESQEDVKSKKAALDLLKNDQTLKSLERDLERICESDKLLAIRPDTCVDDTCPFILSALNVSKEKPGKINEIEKYKTDNAKLILLASENLDISEKRLSLATTSGLKAKSAWDDRSVEIDTLISLNQKDININSSKKQTEVFLIDEMKVKKGMILKSIADIPERIEKLKKLAGQKQNLETAKQMIGSIELSIDDRKKTIESEKNKYYEDSMKRRDMLNDIRKFVSENIPSVSSAVIANHIAAEEMFLVEVDAGLSRVDESISDAEKTIAVLKSKLESNRESSEKIEKLKNQEQFIRKEITRWEYVRAAVSKSGLQAMEIASAAPLLTGIANDLLFNSFGGEFFVDLVTEDPETGAEILDVYITREDGKRFPLFEYSGGESVYILQAFKAAQILVNTEKSGIHFQTAFADEETSALDKDKAERFIKMYRSLMKKGGFEKLFYISHIPECQNLADYVITFTKTGIIYG